MEEKLYTKGVAARESADLVNRLSAKLEGRGPALVTALAGCSNLIDCVRRREEDPRISIGVFGASQAGKSYLVSKMAAGEGARLTTRWDALDIDFISHVNPPGHDHEATGFVTRFSHAVRQGPEGFPIALRIFREIDIVKLLVNTFNNDFDSNKDEIKSELNAELDDAARLQKFFAEIKADRSLQGEGGNAVSLEDVVSLCDYVRATSQWPAQLPPEHPLWLGLRDLAPRLNLRGRVRLFSILWGRLQILSLFYEQIAGPLEKLGGCEEIFAPTAAFLEEMTVGNSGDKKLMQRAGNGTIINIMALTDLLRHQDGEIEVALDEQAERRVTLPFSVLAAISCEMAFPANNDELSSYDVLDFPGARSRQKGSYRYWKELEGGQLEPSADLYGEKDLKDALDYLRRGKVGYLFERYTEREEIDVLMLCIGIDKQQEVSEIPDIVKLWVDRDVGTSPEERRALPHCPLIGVLTKFDTLFEDNISILNNGMADNVDRTMTDPFEKIKEGVWFKNWNGAPFANFFYARKPNLPETVWLDTDKSEKHLETGIKAEVKEQIEFLSNELRRPTDHDGKDREWFAHIRDPRACLEAVMQLNDGGASYIIGTLQQEFARPESFMQRLDARCDNALRKAADLLGTIVISQGEVSESERRRARELTCTLAQALTLSPIYSDLRLLLEPDNGRLEAQFQKVGDSGSPAFFAECAVREWTEAVGALVKGPGFNYLKARFLERFTRNFVGLGSAALRNRPALKAFCSDDGKLLPEAALGDKFRTLMSDLKTELLKAADKFKLKDKLEARLSTSWMHMQGLGSVTDRIESNVGIAARYLSDFNLNLLGLGGVSGPAHFSLRKDASGVELEWNNGLSREAFGTIFDEKNNFTGLLKLPTLNDNTRAHGLVNLGDFLSALYTAMTTAQTEYHHPFGLSEEENAALLEGLEKLSAAGEV